MTNQEFSNNYNRQDDEEIIPWVEDSQFIGFSVLRKYKRDLGFVPATTTNEEDDTVVLIKIGSLRPREETDKIMLRLSVSKHSKYNASHFGFNFEDLEAPTKESYEQSELSLQPIDLEEDTRFTMHLRSLEIFDEETKKIINLNDLVDYLYDIHLQTISGNKALIFKAKLNFRNYFCSKILPGVIDFIKIVLKIFGKEIKDDSEDFAVGLFKKYSFSKHIGTKYPYSLPFFKTDARVSLFNIFWIALTSFLLWTFYFFGKEINETFSLALVVILFIFFEFIIPIILVSLINLSITFRMYLETLPIKFKI